MKTSSYTLKEKLNKFYEEGKFGEVMGELRHYLGTLAKHTRSPLVIELLDMFKMTVDKDIENIDKNLEVLETLFNTPGLDVQVEILAIFSRLATIPSIKQGLFDRYFNEVQTRFGAMSTSARSLIIEILENMSRGMPALQSSTIKFLLAHLDSVEPEVLLDILAVFSRILADAPENETIFEVHGQLLLDRFAFESDSGIETAFVELFMHLPRCKDTILDTSLHWLQSKDYHLKQKALKIIPAIMESRVEMLCISTLLENLKDKNIEFQSSVVDTLAAIMARNTSYYTTRAIRYFLKRDMVESEMLGFVELMTALAGKDFEPVFSKVFDCMTVTGYVADPVTIAIIKSLNEEYPRQLDAAIFKTIESFGSMRTGVKLAILDKVAAITSGLKSEIITVWFAKYLIKLANENEGNEISRKAMTIIEHIRQYEKELDQKINKINEHIKNVELNISTMKNYPRLLRERAPIFTETGDPSSAARMLDAEYHSMLQRIIDFDNFINSLEFKHLIMDLVDEWCQAKDYILDDLNTVKEYISSQIDSFFKEKQADAAAIIRNLTNKKEVVLAEFDDLRSQISRIDTLDHDQVGAITGKITQFTTNLLLFDLEASKMLIEQPVSMEGYQTFIDSWAKAKECIERELDGGIAAIDRWIEKSLHGNVQDPGSAERTMAMHKFFSSFIRSSIQDFRAILDELQSKNEQITSDLSSKKFEDIEKAINFKKSKLLDLIENKAFLIEKYWRALNQASHDIEFLVGINRLKEEWSTTKENIVEKIQRHYHAQLERIDAEKIKQMLYIVHPIPIGSLKGKLRSIPHEDDVKFIAGVIDIVQKHQINALVQNNMLVNMHDFIDPDVSGVPVRIKSSFFPRDAVMTLKVTVENKSIHEIYDVVASLHLPPFLVLSGKSGSDHRKKIPAIECGKNAVFTWDLEDNKVKDPDAADVSVQLSKISIIIGGKLPGERFFSKKEDVSIIFKRT
ncbi:MAG: hypothetical protein Q6353_009790 [Candidatus Sigynarchaeum springense]